MYLHTVNSTTDQMYEKTNHQLDKTAILPVPKSMIKQSTVNFTKGQNKHGLTDQPVDTLLALQILHPSCYIFCHLDQHLRIHIVTLMPQEGEKITTL